MLTRTIPAVFALVSGCGLLAACSSGSGVSSQSLPASDPPTVTANSKSELVAAIQAKCTRLAQGEIASDLDGWARGEAKRDPSAKVQQADTDQFVSQLQSKCGATFTRETKQEFAARLKQVLQGYQTG